MKQWFAVTTALLLLVGCDRGADTGATDTTVMPGGQQGVTNVGQKMGTGRVDRGGGATALNTPEDAGEVSRGTNIIANEPK